MPKRLIFLLLLLIAVSSAAYVVLEDNNFDLKGNSIVTQLSSSPGFPNLTETIKKNVSAPPPLRMPFKQTGSPLTIAGVLSETNKHRALDSLSPLTNNDVLNKAADSKLVDMFAQQYFEHISPDGRGPSDVVGATTYQYLSIGENLALGNFDSDMDLVQAWMDSPGHRANILTSGFQEIGIAVGEGMFEGKKTWLAVQTFGTPTSACPSPSKETKTNLENNKLEIEILGNTLDQERAKIDEDSAILSNLADEINALADQGKIDEANAKNEEARAFQDTLRADQDSYNAKVTQYNDLNQASQELTAVINKEINDYNACVKSL